MSNFKSVRIIGAGGVGFWLTVALVRDEPLVEVEVWDTDTLEGGNGFRRMPWVPDPAEAKVDLLSRFLQFSMGEPPVKSVNRRWEGEGGEGVLIVDCTDAPVASRQVWWDRARQEGATVWRVSYDGNGAVTVSDGLPFVWGAGSEGGYERMPSLAQSFRAGGLGAEAVQKLIHGERLMEFTQSFGIDAVEDI